ncbi:MAG: DUF309 domain-containing protein [Planctomycetaceae bacterium]
MTDLSTNFPAFPPYTYVPGHAPHPISHPDGHMRDTTLPETWSNADYFEWGRRLFNNGFYWEAHEAWEHLWLELGRTTPEAMLVKGLIKLAASGVKCREGNAVGAIRHATRAAELLQSDPGSALFENCDLAAVRNVAKQVASSPSTEFVEPSSKVVVLPEMQV